MPSGPRRDPYLDRLRAIQAETAGIDACLDALESGYTLDAERVDSIVRSQMLARPVRYEDFLSEGELKEIALEYSQALNKGGRLRRPRLCVVGGLRTRQRNSGRYLRRDAWRRLGRQSL